MQTETSAEFVIAILPGSMTWKQNSTYSALAHWKTRLVTGFFLVYGKVSGFSYEFLLAAASTNDNAGWFYYLHTIQNDPLGKTDGWYPYDDDNRKEVEALYGEYQAANQPARLSQRVVTSESSGFQDQVDLLQAMRQTNTQSRKVRPIQRTLDGQKPAVKPGRLAAPKRAAVAKVPAKR